MAKISRRQKYYEQAYYNKWFINKIFKNDDDSDLEIKKEDFISKLSQTKFKWLFDAKKLKNKMKAAEENVETPRSENSESDNTQTFELLPV